MVAEVLSSDSGGNVKLGVRDGTPGLCKGKTSWGVAQELTVCEVAMVTDAGQHL